MFFALHVFVYFAFLFVSQPGEHPQEPIVLPFPLWINIIQSTWTWMWTWTSKCEREHQNVNAICVNVNVNTKVTLGFRTELSKASKTTGCMLGGSLRLQRRLVGWLRVGDRLGVNGLAWWMFVSENLNSKQQFLMLFHHWLLKFVSSQGNVV